LRKNACCGAKAELAFRTPQRFANSESAGHGVRNASAAFPKRLTFFQGIQATALAGEVITKIAFTL